MSSLTRSTLLFGRFFSGILSQVLHSLGVLDFRQLNYVSFGSVIIAFLFSLALPPVKHSIYFDNPRMGADSAETNPDNFMGVIYRIFGGMRFFNEQPM